MSDVGSGFLPQEIVESISPDSPHRVEPPLLQPSNGSHPSEEFSSHSKFPQMAATQASRYSSEASDKPGVAAIAGRDSCLMVNPDGRLLIGQTTSNTDA